MLLEARRFDNSEDQIWRFPFANLAGENLLFQSFR